MSSQHGATHPLVAARRPARFLLLAIPLASVVVGAGLTASAAADPAGSATVTLDCAPGDASSRVVTAFDVELDEPGGTAALYLATPQGGGEALDEVAVGDTVPGDAASRLRWSVVGVQLGPWPVDDVVDECDAALPASGSTLPVVGASVAALLLGTGLALGAVARGARRTTA